MLADVEKNGGEGNTCYESYCIDGVQVAGWDGMILLWHPCGCTKSMMQAVNPMDAFTLPSCTYVDAVLDPVWHDKECKTSWTALYQRMQTESKSKCKRAVQVSTEAAATAVKN